jgi:CHAD domain-containing protein
MAYRLSLEGIPDSLRRVGRDQLDAAAAGLDRPDDPVEAVHDARKRLKKSRALLRLARPALRRREFRTANRALRDQARALSAARDADVLGQTVDALAERFAGRLPKARFDAVRAAVEGRSDGPGELPATDLHALASGADSWPVDGVGHGTLERGLGTTYRRGRAAFETADADPKAENLHAWRKRVKDLWYQQRLLEQAWPGLLKAQAAEAKTLSKLLGDDHDLAVLREHVQDDDVRALIDQRRAELLEEARALGRRVYAERPKAYRRRLRTYLRAVA